MGPSERAARNSSGIIAQGSKRRSEKYVESGVAGAGIQRIRAGASICGSLSCPAGQRRRPIGPELAIDDLLSYRDRARMRNPDYQAPKYQGNRKRRPSPE